MKQGRSGLGYYTIGISALFLAGFLMLVLIGAGAYRNTVESQNGNADARALVSYLSTCVKAGDSEGAVTVRDSEYGPLLEIAAGQSGYARRIYVHEGALVEDFARASRPLSPENAQILGKTAVWQITERENGLLEVKTDGGSVLIRLRSGR